MGADPRQPFEPALTERPNIVVVDANAYWTASLFSELSAFGNVLLVKPRDIRAHAAVHPRSALKAKVNNVSPGVKELAFAMPPKFTTLMWPIARRIIASAISAEVQNVNTLVVCFPDYLDLAKMLNPRQLVYYNYDDYAAHWPHRSSQIRRLELETVSQADHTICIAKRRADELRKAVPAKKDKITHLPIGVTPQFMSEALRAQSEPTSLMGIPKPRAGYIGALSYRFDFPLLASVAELLPNVSFVLGGRLPVRNDGDPHWWAAYERARALPNVYLVGWVDHDQLGRHLAAMDVLLMLYAKCAFNDSACPAKLWDYLGTGLPIVSNANNPETLLWREIVSIGDSPIELVEAIKKSINTAGLEYVSAQEARLAVANDHTWPKLGRRLKETVFSNAYIRKN